MLIRTIILAAALIISSNMDLDAQREQKNRPVSIENGKIFKKNGKKLLYGGEHESNHFDISNSVLKDEQYHYGIGRERFPALLHPEFFSVEEADKHFKDDARFLVLQKDGITKAYSIKDLTRHEIVNDEINGEPVMAAYCILADLGAIYDRTLLDRKFTFAVSGYTYYDPKVWDGMDGFVLWDRETESLWWPLIGEAVSGPLKGTKMQVLDEKYWAQTSWKDIKRKFSDAQVLIPNQDYERPESWPQYNDIKNVNESSSSEKSISPRWGENTKLQNIFTMQDIKFPVEEIKLKLRSSGKNFIEPFTHGTLRIGMYSPKKVDHQQAHVRDEVYVIIAGTGNFFCNGERVTFAPGDVLFVPAKADHRFEDFSDDFSTWVLFYGPEGGEKP